MCSGRHVFMYKIITAILSMLLLTPAAYTQVQSVTLPVQVHLDASKPLVYLEFERYEGEQVWMRLRNNSVWTVVIRTEEPENWQGQRDVSGLKDSVEVSPQYEIQSIQPEKSVYITSCTLSESSIPSGRSVLFKVPKVSLLNPGFLRVYFTYEWESRMAQEPRNYAYFSGLELLRSH